MIYRRQSDDRFRTFPLRFRHTDAQLGLNGLLLDDDLLHQRLSATLAGCYRELELEFSANPQFATSLTPLAAYAKTTMGLGMAAAAQAFGVGPMAAVAGAVSQAVLAGLSDSCHEIYCENGGDIAIRNQSDLKVSVFPGGPPFNRPILLTLPPGSRGIASSSGEYGHSFSRGQAQMVTVIADNAVLSDAAATALANQVQPGCNPQAIVEQTFPGIQAILVIWQEVVYYRGDFELGFA